MVWNVRIPKLHVVLAEEEMGFVVDPTNLRMGTKNVFYERRSTPGRS